MHPLQAQRVQAQRVQAQQGAQETGGPQANAIQQIPATDFIRYDVAPDGDCLFRSSLMGDANRAGLRVSDHQVMELRQKAANYVLENQDALIANPSFGDVVGVHNLRDLLSMQGQWAGNAGDLVPPILARVLDREVRILAPSQQDGFYEANNNRYYNPQSEVLPPAIGHDGANELTVKPPIYLLHIAGSHYDCLKLHAPQADIAPQRDINLQELHTHFGIRCQNMMTLEKWNNDEWGESTFMQLSDQPDPVCVDKSLILASFSNTEFGNAIGGNAEGHGSRLGADRYVKVTPQNGNFFLLVNRGSEAEVDSLKKRLEKPDNNDLAAVMSFEYQYEARVAAVSSRNGQEYIEIGASRSHGQSKCSVYRLVGHQSKSIEQAKALAKSEKSLFDEIGMEQNLNPQRRDGPIEEFHQPPRKRARTGASQVGTAQATNSDVSGSRMAEVVRTPESGRRVLMQAERIAIRNGLIQAVSQGVSQVMTQAFTQALPPESPRMFAPAFTDAFDEAFPTALHRASNQESNQGGLPQAVNQALNQALNQTLNQMLTQARTQRLPRAFTQALNHMLDQRLNHMLDQRLNQALAQSLSRAFPDGLPRARAPQAFPQRVSRDRAADAPHSELRRSSQQTANRPIGLRAAHRRRREIMNAFTQSNNRPFAALTEDEQRAEVLRIAQVTNQDESVVRAALNNRGNRP